MHQNNKSDHIKETNPSVIFSFLTTVQIFCNSPLYQVHAQNIKV